MTTVRFALAGISKFEGQVFSNTDYPVSPALLISYFYYKSFAKIRDKVNMRDWVLDSGAFSAKHSGAVIDLDEYIAFCKEIKKNDPKLTEIYALDVIGDHVGSLKNTEKMWEEGIEAIPCYHLGEPWEVLDHYAANYPKVAMGSPVALRGGTKKRDWFNYGVTRIWPKRVHGFGCASENVILSVPFHSVDASSWVAPERFGAEYKLMGKITLPPGSNHHLEMEVQRYLDIEAKAKYRWKKEMEILEQCP